jgi:hypothetical protein
MRRNSEYWGSEATDEAFTAGISGGIGDEYLASSFTPGFANTLADLLDILAAGSGKDLCSHTDTIYNTARELAERYPGLDLAGRWPLALRPRPAEPEQFAARITGWVKSPSEDCDWVNLGNDTWASQRGGRASYADITVTGIPDGDR